MAFAITSTYCGEDSQVWVMKALIGGDTLANDCLTLIPNIKFKAPVNRIQSSGLIQADSCSFTQAGTVTIDERLLAPEAMKVNLELCVTDLEAQWVAARMRPGALNDDIPAPLAEFIVEEQTKTVAAAVELLLWNGDTGGGDVFDGIITKLVAAGGFLAPAAPSAVTVGNVITKLQEMYDLIPDEVCDEPDLKFFVSKKISKLYKQAVAAASAEAHFIGARPLDFLGMPMVALRGLTPDQMLVAQVGNLFVGTDLESDLNEVRTIDMRETTGDDTLRYKMRFKLDTQFAFAGEIVLHNFS
jgi:hypothetical protein